MSRLWRRSIECWRSTLEDRQTHYNRMLALRALGRDGEAARAEAAFERYRIDEAALALTRAYREHNPGVNLMAQAIRMHDLEVLVSETASEDSR